MNIDRWMQCESRTQFYPQSGVYITGHNYSPTPAYITDDDILHMNLKCKWCGYLSEGWKPYEGESPQFIKKEYGFVLDEGY